MNPSDGKFKGCDIVHDHKISWMTSKITYCLTHKCGPALQCRMAACPHC